MFVHQDGGLLGRIYIAPFLMGIVQFYQGLWIKFKWESTPCNICLSYWGSSTASNIEFEDCKASHSIEHQDKKGKQHLKVPAFCLF